MKFHKVLNEYRNYDPHAVNVPKEKKENKVALLQAKGYDVSFDFIKDELLVAKPNGDIINIYNDTSRVYFEYTSDEAREKWRQFYRRLFPDEGKRSSSYTKKDGTKTTKKEGRYEPSDFLKNGYLRRKLEVYGKPYDEFMQDLAKDVRVLFV